MYPCPISIHAPVSGATDASDKAPNSSQFQSTHPCGVRLSLEAAVDLFAHFDPRTRVGCDDLSEGLMTLDDVFQSTHPCWVRKLAIRVLGLCIHHFNPRTCVVCDNVSLHCCVPIILTRFTELSISITRVHLT